MQAPLVSPSKRLDLRVTESQYLREYAKFVKTSVGFLRGPQFGWIALKRYSFFLDLIVGVRDGSNLLSLVWKQA
jgi:hypothetical protein